MDSRSAERASGSDPENEREPLTLARAANWLRTRGPRVRELVASYQTALARAQVATPWPNPGLEIGPEFGFGSDVDVNRLVPVGTLHLSIPLSGRTSRQDEVNLALAQAARINAIGRFRELYLDLRARYVQVAVAQAREAVRGELLLAAKRSLDVAGSLVDAGSATALDVALFQLEHAREKSRVVGASLESARAEDALAELLATTPARVRSLPRDALPMLPAVLPKLSQLASSLADRHPGLLSLCADYEIAERQLHLEVAKQYPDLTFGSSLAGETGERKTVFGLSLGIELPLFDRNQQNIAEARQRREEIRIRYEAAADRALCQLESAHRALALITTQRQVLENEVLPAARTSVGLALRSLAAGTTSALQVLDAERSRRQVEIELLEARLAEQLAWSDLERAAGQPFVIFPAGPATPEPAPPPELTEPGDDR